MQNHINATANNLGELAAMASQTEAAERKIMSAAVDRLAKVEKELPSARVSAMAGTDEQKDAYNRLIGERGQLNQVIAQSREHLGS